MKQQKARMRSEGIARIEEATRSPGEEPIRLEFLEEALVAYEDCLSCGDEMVGYD